jgi:DNA-binding GntR family transcriptional regulator
VLADRLAALFAHREPGWRLPRHSTLARRYHVSQDRIEEAVRELIGRHLISQLPDGQLYRASPALYLIPVPGLARLAAHVDPLGSQLRCRDRKVTWRRIPEDISWALGIQPRQPVCSVRCSWDAGSEPAAISTTYLAPDLASHAEDLADSLAAEASVVPAAAARTEPPAAGDGHALGLARALQLEMQPPPAAVARALRLAAGQPAAMVTLRFDDPGSGRPVALTAAVLRADMFRIVVESS